MSEGWLRKRALEEVSRLVGCSCRDQKRVANTGHYDIECDTPLAPSIADCIEAVAREFAERALQHGLYGKLLEVPHGDASIAAAIAEADKDNK